MRRAELTKLTGLTPEFFNSLARRDQFPFLRRPVTGVRGWGNYPPRYAYMTLLALALAHAGATQTEAGHFIDVEFELLSEAGLTPADIEQGNIYLGYARRGSSETDPELGRYLTSTIFYPLCGTIDAIARKIADLEPKKDLLSLVLVNASEQLRMLRDRVLEHDLDPATVDQAVFPEVRE